MSLEESEKEVRIIHIHANTYHLVKKCKNRSSDPEIIVLKLKKTRRAIAQAACDVHNDDNENAWQRGPLWPHGMGPINTSKIYRSVGKFAERAKWAATHRQQNLTDRQQTSSMSGSSTDDGGGGGNVVDGGGGVGGKLSRGDWVSALTMSSAQLLTYTTLSSDNIAPLDTLIHVISQLLVPYYLLDRVLNTKTSKTKPSNIAT